ncbi:hypothetical protein ACVIQS_010238, partial [Bradyrhizobium diazoefficiens]
QPVFGRFALLSLSLTSRRTEFRRIDVSDSDLHTFQPEGISVDDTGDATALTA